MNAIFPDHLSSPRLILRRLRPGDASALSGYRSLPEVARYQSWESFDLDDARRLVEGQSEMQPNILGTWLQLAIIEQATENMVGDCGLHCLRNDQMEIGITVDPRHQRRGYATEAVSCLVDYSFGVLNTHRVIATTDAENTAAARLFERLGFRREAHFVENTWFKGRLGSEFSFAFLKREWNKRRK